MRTAGRLRREQESPERVSNEKKSHLTTSFICRSSSHCPVFDHLLYSKAIKNWTAGRPGNKATIIIAHQVNS